MRPRRITRSLPLFLLCAVLALAAAAARAAPPTWPTAREVWRDDFEAAALDAMWEDNGGGRISVSTSAAQPPSSRGLAVDVSGADQTYLQRYNLTPWPHLEFPRDTYFRFVFHPHGATIPAGQDVALLRMRDGDWNVLVGLRLRREATPWCSSGPTDRWTTRRWR